MSSCSAVPTYSGGVPGTVHARCSAVPTHLVGEQGTAGTGPSSAPACTPGTLVRKVACQLTQADGPNLASSWLADQCAAAPRNGLNTRCLKAESSRNPGKTAARIDRDESITGLRRLANTRKCAIAGRDNHRRTSANFNAPHPSGHLRTRPRASLHDAVARAAPALAFSALTPGGEPSGSQNAFYASRSAAARLPVVGVAPCGILHAPPDAPRERTGNADADDRDGEAQVAAPKHGEQVRPDRRGPHYGEAHKQGTQPGRHRPSLHREAI